MLIKTKSSVKKYVEGKIHHTPKITNANQMPDSNIFDIDEFDTFDEWTIDNTVELI